MADWDDEPIGYGKPPHWSRFEKGKSGNPNGRPRKQKASTPSSPGESPVDDVLRQTLAREIKATDAGRSVRLNMLEAVTRAQVNSAAKGNAIAQRDVLKQARELNERDAARKAAREQQDRDTFDGIVLKQGVQARKWVMVVPGCPEAPDLWPHPDDIVIDHASARWSIRGPYDEEELPLYEYYRAARDHLFVNCVLERRQRKASQQAQVSIYDIWTIYDALLPKRWQLDDGLEAVLAVFWLMPLRKLRAFEKTYAKHANEFERRANLPPRDKDVYRTVNMALKPLLKQNGYRSLAEFEGAYARFGEKMPWPKQGAAR